MAEKAATIPTVPTTPGMPLMSRGPVSEAKFSWDDPAQRTPAILLIVFTLLAIYAYWQTLVDTSVAWEQDLYSHGYVVPFMALGIMWIRRKAFEPVPALERWIGLGILVACQLARLYATRIDMAPVDQLSFVGSLFGIFLMVGGWHVIKWAAPGILLLVFMFPLPSRVEQTVLMTLQKWAAAASTIVLQTLGVAAFRTGNVIDIPGIERMEVAEACSGMRMLTIFCAMAIAMVFFIDRPWWDKLVILLSAVPIALIANITRITLTGLLFLALPDKEWIHKLIHDGAGYFMMFIGLGLLWLEMQILNRLSVPEEEGVHVPAEGLMTRGRGVVPVR
jgi:exosortase